MNIEEYEAFKNLVLQSPKVNVYMLANRTPRTLLFGCGLVGPATGRRQKLHTHVYLGADQLIHVVHYKPDNNQVASYKAAVEFSLADLVPGRLSHPEFNDLEFCKLLHAKGAPVVHNFDHVKWPYVPLFHSTSQ